MNDTPTHNADGDSEEQQLESILNEFDQKLHSGEPSHIGDFLQIAPRAMCAELLCELIKIDLEYRWKHGDHRLVEEYLAEFPELGNIHDLPAELIEEEIYCRQRFAAIPDLSELQKRFPNRASQLRLLIEHSSEAAKKTKNKKSLSSLINAQSSGSPTRESIPKQPGGKTLAGRFELKDRLGQGAFATVFRAWDKVLQRPVAVKIARGALANDIAMAQRFLREAQSAARLEHPGIVSVYEVGEEDDQFYMVQELIQGGTLADQMNGEPMSFVRVAQVVAEICTAMDYAHRCGIVHRDLKPANIMMDRDDHPRIADFGMATRADAALTLTQEGDLLGTPAYMAPEQARADHENVGQAADTYSAGVILYQLMCQRLPFTGDPLTVVSRVVHEDPVAPRKIRRSVPVDLQTICQKAMEKDPARRYRSAGAMAEDLHRYLNNEPITARPAGPVEQLWKWCQRRPALAATIAASLVLLSTLAVASYISISGERDKFREQRDLAQKETSRANEETIRANRTLFDALTNNVENELRNRDTGWHKKAFETIRNAAALEIPDRDSSRLRELAIELLTDTSIRLEQTDSWQPHRGGLTVISIAVNDSGEFAAFGFNDGLIRLAGLHDQDLNIQLVGTDEIMRHLVIDRDNRWVAGWANDQIWFWDLPEELFVKPDARIKGRKLPHENCSTMSISDDQSLIAIGYDDGDIVVYEFNDGNIGEIENELIKHMNAVTTIDISPDNLLLCSAARDGIVIQWDLSRDSVVGSHNNVDWIQFVKFGKSERQLMFADDSSFSFVTWVPGQPPVTHRGPAIIRQALFLQNGQVATASLDGALRLWSSSTVSSQVTGLDELFSIAVGPDDKYLLVGNRGGIVRKFDIARDSIARDFRTTHRCAIDSSGVLHTEIERTPLTPDDGSPTDAQAYEVHNVCAFAEDPISKLLLAGTTSGALIRHQIDGGENEIVRDIHSHPIVKIVLALDGSWYASIDQSGKGCIHDSSTHEVTREISFSVGQVFTVADSMDGKWLLVGGSRGYQIVDVSGDTFELRTVIQQYQSSAAATFGEDCLLLARPGGVIDVRDPSGRKIESKLRGHSESVTAMAFTFDGKQLYTASADKRLILWDWPEAKQLKSVTVISPIGSIAVDPDQEFLVTTFPGVCEFRDPETLETRVQTRFWGLRPGGHRFGHAGKYIWLGSAGVIRYQRSVIRRLFNQAEESGQVQFLNCLDGRKTTPGGYSNQVWGIAIAPNQPWMATTDHDGRVMVYDTNTGYQLQTIKGHDPVTWSASFSHDSRLLATGGARGGKGEVIIWDTDEWKLHKRVSIGKQLTACVEFHPQLPLVVAGTYGGTLDLIDARSGKVIQELFRLYGRVDDTRFSPDGSKLLAACGSKGVFVWDVSREGESIKLSSEPVIFRMEGEQHRAATFSSQGNEIAIGSENGTVRIFNVQNQEVQLKINSAPRRIRQITFSADDRFLACAGYAVRGRVWDLQLLLGELDNLELLMDNRKRSYDH